MYKYMNKINTYYIAPRASSLAQVHGMQPLDTRIVFRQQVSSPFGIYIPPCEPRILHFRVQSSTHVEATRQQVHTKE